MTCASQKLLKLTLSEPSGSLSGLVLLASKAFKMLVLPAAPVLPELAPPPHAPSTSKLLNTANSAATLRESLTISMPSLNTKSVMHGLLSSPDMLGFKHPSQIV
jgi:hypothetical protein